MLFRFPFFDHQPHNQIPFSRHDHDFPTTQDHANVHCSVATININIHIKSLDLFLSLRCTPHIYVHEKQSKIVPYNNKKLLHTRTCIGTKIMRPEVI